MDLQHLWDTYPKLIFYMKENNYSESYVSRFEKEIRRILLLADSKGWKSYTDVYLDYTRTSNSSDYLRNKRTILGAIENFELHGLHPNSRRRHTILRKTGYDSLSPEFKTLIDHYCQTERVRGKKGTTIYGESHNAASFLLALQQREIFTLDAVTERYVLDFFIDSEGKLIKSCSYKKNIAAVLKACVPLYPEGCRKVLSYLPALREKRKNIQYLTCEEVECIKSVLMNKDSGLSLRDQAIGLLALYTGLRCCDIARLSLRDIDWVNDRICLKQQKTEIPLELPLNAAVGNAIYDYLTNERPKTNVPEIFLSQSHPHTRMKSKSLSNTVKKIMKAAKIREAAGDRKGFHIFRHHLATALLGNGVLQPVISKTLGHASPATLNTYLSADFTHLKECALGIEKFPLRKGVLG